MNDWFWVWLGLVAVFTVAEIIEGGGFVGPWALGAAAAAVLEALSASITLQWLAFIGLSGLVFVIWRRTFYPVTRPQTSSAGAARAAEKSPASARERP